MCSSIPAPVISRSCPLAGRTDVRRRLVLALASFGALAIAAIVLAPLVGSTSISLARVFDRSIPFGDNVDAQIFFIARLPRVLAAALVGSGLAMAGVVFQALLRNPLASPDTLGVSAGASLGAMLAIIFHLNVSVLGVSAIPVASFIGLRLSVLLMHDLAKDAIPSAEEEEPPLDNPDQPAE